jgi:hypothetical protein
VFKRKYSVLVCALLRLLYQKIYFMANEVIALDPFGKTIHLLHGVSFDENENEEVYDDVVTVIEKPALVIEVKENEETQFYYFRSVGWSNTLLIKVHRINNRWEAYDFVKNASSQFLSSLLKKGKQIF